MLSDAALFDYALSVLLVYLQGSVVPNSVISEDSCILGGLAASVLRELTIHFEAFRSTPLVVSLLV